MPLPPQFDTLINDNPIPVLVDFYAPWCGPCKTLAPVIQQIASEYKDRILTIKINTDAKPDLAQKWQIQSVPSILLFFKGQVKMRLAGAHPYNNLKRELDAALINI